MNFIRKNRIRLVFYAIIALILIVCSIGIRVSVTESTKTLGGELDTEITVSPIPTLTVVPSSTPIPLSSTPVVTNTPTPSPLPTETPTPTCTPIPTNTPTPTPSPLPKIYDVKLDAEIQWYLLGVCKANDVPFNLAMATIWKESRYNPNAINNNGGKSTDAGLFQINDCNWDMYSRKFEDWDPFDPYDSCDAGVAHIKYCMQYDKKPTCFMMVYNMGLTGARRLWKKGTWSSEYSRELVDYMENVLPGLQLIDY